EENAARNYKMFHGIEFEGGWHRVGLGAAPAPTPGIEAALTELDRLRAEAATTGSDVKNSLDVSAKPNIDLADLIAARNLAREALNLIQQIGAASASAAANTDRQMRRSMADYGVAP